MPKKKIKPIRTETKKFKIFLDCAGKKYVAKADTIQKALDILFKASLGMIKTWGVFTLETGGKKSEIRLRPIQIKRAFIMRFAKDLFEKRMILSLK